MEGTVTLIVKAANQSVEDQRLECDSDWTVLNLKSHLSTAHPSKPKVEEQRLIYSGQLLQDGLKLRSVLRHPTENNAYTVHLVCSPPRNPPTPPSPASSVASHQQQSSPRRMGGAGNSAGMAGVQTQEGVAGSSTPENSESMEGLRRRTNATVDEGGAATPQGIEAAAGYPTGYPTQAQVSMSVLQATTDPVQQMATMQQMYANYMAYMQYIQMGGGLAGGIPWPQQMLHHIPASPPNAPSSTQSATTATADVGEQQQQQEQLDQNNPPNPQQPQPLQQQQQQPQIRMNAQGGEVDDDDENEGLGRDWLDWIYVLSRMVVLLSVVYFYSTVSRFMIVVCMALLLYLYQAGWFRPARRAPEQPPQGIDDPNEVAQDDRNNNINNNNNNNEVHVDRLQMENNNNNNNVNNNNVNNNNIVQDEPPPLLQQQVDGGRDENLAGTDRGLDADELHVRPSLLALSWTFLTTFFTSLIPDQPQVI